MLMTICHQQCCSVRPRINLPPSHPNFLHLPHLNSLLFWDAFWLPEINDILLPICILRTETIFIAQPKTNRTSLKASILVKQY